MKILVIGNTSRSLFRFRKGLLTHLSKTHTVHVISPKDSCTETLQRLPIIWHNLKMSRKSMNPFSDLYLLCQLWRYTKCLQPDLLIHYTIKPVIYGSLVGRFLSVPTINIITGLGSSFMGKRWIQKIVEQLYRFSQKKVQRIFFLNPEDQALFQNAHLVTSQQTALLPGEGIDMETFLPAPFPDAFEPFHFLFIGRLIRDKGILEYLEAARRIKMLNPNVRFSVLGEMDTGNPTSLTSLNPYQNDVDFLGHQEDVSTVITSSHCVVLPSYREGIPRVLLEAGALERPVITTDVPGCRDVVDDQTGWLCRAHDVDDLVHAMETVLKTPRDRLIQIGKQGRVKVAQNFNETLVIQCFMNCIKDLSDRSRTHTEEP